MVFVNGKKVVFVPKKRMSGRKGGSKALSKLQKKQVKALVAKPTETKYRAQPSDEYSNQILVTNELLSKHVNADYTTLQKAFPTLLTGTDSDTRIGNRINLISGRTHFYMFLDYQRTATTDVFVKLYLLNSKSAKSEDATLALTAGQLLQSGGGITQDWVPSATDTHITDMMPINKEQFTGITKTFRLSKNGGGSNNDATAGAPATANLPQGAYHRFTWNWGKKMTIKYGENGGLSDLPSNFYPLWGAVCWYSDNTPVGVDGSAMPAKLYARSEIYYKDP